MSLETQETDARAFVERKGWDVAEVYVDAGRSAWADDRVRDRPEFARPPSSTWTPGRLRESSPGSRIGWAGG